MLTIDSFYWLTTELDMAMLDWGNLIEPFPKKCGVSKLMYRIAYCEDECIPPVFPLPCLIACAPDEVVCG